MWNALIFNPVTNSAFQGVFARDTLNEISKKPKLIICNTDPSYKKGEHWVLFYFNENSVDFFDSLGRDIYYYGNDFVNFVKRFVTQYEFCEERLQPLKSSLCGHYCLFYAYFRCLGFSMSNIVDRMKSHKYVENFVKENFCICKNSKCKLLQTCTKN